MGFLPLVSIVAPLGQASFHGHWVRLILYVSGPAPDCLGKIVQKSKVDNVLLKDKPNGFGFCPQEYGPNKSQ